MLLSLEWVSDLLSRIVCGDNGASWEGAKD